LAIDFSTETLRARVTNYFCYYLSLRFSSFFGCQIFRIFTFFQIRTCMAVSSLPTEIILNSTQATIGKVVLDWVPQPGDYLDFECQTYAVLERRHCYQYRAGHYRLGKISVYVQTANRPQERSLIGGKWVIGDASCVYNARSELLRCAVLPQGPCQECPLYQQLTNDFKEHL
jgi:Family of unknown function (DUF6464)